MQETSRTNQELHEESSALKQRIHELEQTVFELKQRLEADKEIELRYKSLIEHSNDAAFCVDKRGEYKFVNWVFASTFGKTPDYFLGKTFWDVYPKEHADHRQAANIKVFETGESQSIEVVVPLADRILYYIAKANPVKDDNGEVVLNLVYAVDISERKRAEERLRQSEEKYRSLVENLNDIIFSCTAEGFLTFVSPSWTRLLGHTPEEVVGLSFKELVHPDDHLACYALLQKVVEAGGKIEGVEHRMRHKNGEWRWHSSSGNPQKDASGAVTGFDGILRDITERKQAEETLRESEERHRSVLQTTKDGFWIVSLPEGMVTDVNETYCRMTGYSRAEMLKLKIPDLDAFLTPGEQAAKIKRIITDGSGIFETCHRRKDGTVFDVEISVTHNSANGEELICFCRDITERKRVEEERKRLITELQKALSDVKKLSGLLPICSSCKKIRDDKGYWNQIESFIRDHSGAEFTHSICPECAKKLYPELFDKK